MIRQSQSVQPCQYYINETSGPTLSENRKLHTAQRWVTCLNDNKWVNSVCLLPPSNWEDRNYKEHSACIIWIRNINTLKVNFQNGTEAITQLLRMLEATLSPTIYLHGMELNLVQRLHLSFQHSPAWKA